MCKCVLKFCKNGEHGLTCQEAFSTQMKNVCASIYHPATCHHMHEFNGAEENQDAHSSDPQLFHPEIWAMQMIFHLLPQITCLPLNRC